MPDELNALVEGFLKQLFDERPEMASALGVDGYDERLGDYSAEGFTRRESQAREWVRRFGAVPDEGLSSDERIDRDLALSSIRGDILLHDWKSWRRSADTYVNPGLYGIFNLFLHRIRPEPELAAAAESRLRAIPGVLECGKANLDPERGHPALLRRALDACRAGATYARHLVPAEVSDPAGRERVAEAGEIAARAYEDFAEFLDKFAASATGGYAIGADLYTALLRERELLGFDVYELRERGRAAYEELSAEMSRLAREVAGTGDWRAAMEELNEDHPTTPEEMRDLYEQWTERARQFLIDRSLVTLPEGEQCLVEPSPPFQRPVLAVANYSSPPAFKPSRTGHFFVPFPPEGTPPEEIQQRLKSNARHVIPTVSVHEAYPGHHWHLVHAQQNPRALRKVLGSSYFAEGWALYTEVMMREEGLYSDPRDELGVLDARIFRAARIIVDTSLHLGEMSMDEAIAFMRDNALSEPIAVAEVKRYCAWPTQASSYLTGSLEIERIRARYFAERRGDLRSFHDSLAGAGAMPVGLHERAVLD